MTKHMGRRWRLAFLVGAAVAVLAACGAKSSVVVDESSADNRRSGAQAADFVHEYTGFGWIREYGNFVRANTNSYDRRGYDQSASYNGPGARVTIYIYPHATDDCLQTLDDFAPSFVDLLQRLHPGGRVEVGTIPFISPPGDDGLFVMAADGTITPDSTADMVLLWEQNGWLVKCRITMLVSQGEDGVGAALQLLAMMDWPDFHALPAHSLTTADIYGTPSNCAITTDLDTGAPRAPAVDIAWRLQ